MRPIEFSRANSVAQALAQVREGSAFLAGGTTEVDLLRLNVLPDTHLIDINALPLAEIEHRADGGVQIGALARMSDVAADAGMRERFPMIVQSLELAASAQLRNMASIAGNIMQKTRCSYYRDVKSPCNKREPGSGCAAITGINRSHAVLGTSDACIATHHSDLTAALVALDTVVKVQGPQGQRDIPFEEFFLLPGDTPHLEHTLAHDEIITGLEVPALDAARTSLYLKVRDRESYEFALASVAVALSVKGSNIDEVRMSLGGVATRPWRCRKAEVLLKGQLLDTADFAAAAHAELEGAQPRSLNAFKIPLAERTIVRGLKTVREQVTGETK